MVALVWYSFHLCVVSVALATGSELHLLLIHQPFSSVTLCEHQPRVTPALQPDWGCIGNAVLEATEPCLDESVRLDPSSSVLSAPSPEECMLLAATLLTAHHRAWLDGARLCRVVSLLLGSEQGRTGLRQAVVHLHHQEIGSTTSAVRGEVDTMSLGRAAKWAAGGGGGVFELGISQENLQMLCLSLEQDSQRIAQAGRHSAVDLFVKAVDASLVWLWFQSLLFPGVCGLLSKGHGLSCRSPVQSER